MYLTSCVMCAIWNSTTDLAKTRGTKQTVSHQNDDSMTPEGLVLDRKDIQIIP